MQIITLYKYYREDGGITVSPIKPDAEYTEMYRLIADEGKILTNGTDYTMCTDVEDPESWYEDDYSEEDSDLSSFSVPPEDDIEVQ